MKKQFLKEHHNRLEKAHKPDYREDFFEFGRNEPAGTFSMSIPVEGKSLTVSCWFLLNCSFFTYRKIRWQRWWSVEHFAKENRLTSGSAAIKKRFARLTSKALEDIHAMLYLDCDVAIRVGKKTNGMQEYTFIRDGVATQWKAVVSLPPVKKREKPKARKKQAPRGNRLSPSKKKKKKKRSQPVPESNTLPGPITVRGLADEAGKKPFVVVADLMEMGVFAEFNKQIEWSVALKLMEKYKREQTSRGVSAAGVENVF